MTATIVAGLASAALTASCLRNAQNVDEQFDAR